MIFIKFHNQFKLHERSKNFPISKIEGSTVILFYDKFAVKVEPDSFVAFFVMSHLIILGYFSMKEIQNAVKRLNETRVFDMKNFSITKIILIYLMTHVYYHMTADNYPQNTLLSRKIALAVFFGTPIVLQLIAECF